MKKENTRDHYSKFLGEMEWTYFATCTTGYELTLKSARRVMERFHFEITKYCKCTLFWVAEKYKAKDGFHTHALINVPEHCPYDLIIQLWQKVTGGKSENKWQRIRLESYQPDKGASNYCTKYLLKEVADWDILRKRVRIANITRVQANKKKLKRHKFKKSGKDFTVITNIVWK